MVVISFADVILRYFFNKPIKGVYSITEVMLITVVFLGLAYTQSEKGHVSIDLITNRLSSGTRLIWDNVLLLITIGMTALMTWQSFIQFLVLLHTGVMQRQYLAIPRYPFMAILFIGLVLFLLLLLRDFVNNLAEGIKRRLKGYQWLLMFGIPILFLVLAILWIQPTLFQLSLPVIAMIGLVFSVAMFITGLPIAFCLLLTGFLFIGHICGPDSALYMLGVDPYGTVGSYTWVVVTFFILMGSFVLHAKFGEDVYLTAHRWIGHFRAGLAYATIAACAAMSAIVGTSIAVVGTMTSIALPEMRKYKYDDSLSAGTIVGGSALGPIIPPSIIFILYGILSGVSIGDLFIGGIIPGLLLAFMFCIMIFFWSRLNPNIGLPGKTYQWGQRLVSLRSAGPVLILFLLVIGGLYTGIFTPSEGGAIGAFGAFILGLLYRRFTWKNFAKSLLESGQIIAMVFLILIGAQIFTRFLVWCNVADAATRIIAGAHVSPLVVVLFIELIFFILGFIMDILPLILIGVPILHPIIVALGVNPLWFAMITCIVINLGTLTPPIGMNLFTLKAMEKNIPISVIYRGAMPFVYATVAGLLVLWFVPSLVTWLPDLLK